MDFMGNQNYKAFWEEAFAQLREEYKKDGKEVDFNLWFNMEYVEDNQDEITVSVPSKFMWDQIVSRGNIEKLENKINSLGGLNIKISKYVINENFSPAKTEESEPEPEKEIYKPVVQKSEEKQGQKHPQLNEDYTFESFVSGDNNAFAYNASLAVSKNPGTTYNPLLLYGGVGLGKTHLMQAIGNYIWNNSEESAKICYVSTENFMNEFTTAIRDKNPNNKTIEKFKNKYRKLDVLLLDDIQFLEGKEALQEELFYTFESLFNNKKQMVFTCDRPMTDVKGIQDRLRSRFTRGMSVDMKAPNYETRMAIIQKKLSIMGKSVSGDVVDYIAKKIESNVRDIESGITKIVGYSDLTGKTVTLDVAIDLLRDTVSQVANGSISVDTVIKVVADHYNISVSDIKGKKRNRQFIVPRQIAIYLSRELTELSYPDLGNEFGGRDHTTIMHSYEKIESDLKTDSSLGTTIQSLIRDIKDYKK